MTKNNSKEPKKKPKPDCCWDNIDNPKHVSRATWVCPVCGKDVSLMYVMYYEAITKQTK